MCEEEICVGEEVEYKEEEEEEQEICEEEMEHKERRSLLNTRPSIRSLYYT